MADGVLSRLSDRCYKGTLGAYRVEVFLCLGQWHAGVSDAARGHTCVQLAGRSVADAAARARAWVESRRNEAPAAPGPARPLPRPENGGH